MSEGPAAGPTAGLQERLAAGHEALLGYPTGRGPRRLVVRYVLCTGQLLFRLPTYSSALGYAADQPVTMQVPVQDEAGDRCGDLLVRATAALADHQSWVGADDALREQWPDGVPRHVLALPATHVELVPAG